MLAQIQQSSDRSSVHALKHDRYGAHRASRNGTCSAVSPEATTVRVVTIKHPPAAIDGITPDNSAIGRKFDLPPQLAILMIAAGWVRADTRSLVRRHNDHDASINRRQTIDRRSLA